MRCCIIGCEAPTTAPVSIYRLIRKGTFREDWVKAIEKLNGQIIDKSTVSKSIAICEKHFEPSCLKNYGRARYLVDGSIPTIFPGIKRQKMSAATQIDVGKLSSRKWCCVSQCPGYRPGISMHQIPKNVLSNHKKLLEWKNILKREDLSPKHFHICSRHFEKGQILKPLPRGKRSCALLLDSAFPTLNLPKSPVNINEAGERVEFAGTSTRTDDVENKSKLICNVSQCRKYPRPGISMHRIPKRVLSNCKERLKWKVLLKMKKPFPKNFHICSRHFKKGQIIYTLPKGKRSRGYLLDWAYPTLNLPKSSVIIKLAKDIKARLRRLMKIREEIARLNENDEQLTSDLTETEGIETNEAKEVKKTIIEAIEPIQATELIKTTEPTQPNAFQFISLGTQKPKLQPEECIRVDMFETIYIDNLPFRLDTDYKLNTMTGIPDRKILEDIVSKCLVFRQSEGGKGTVASLENKIILTMYRLKNNVSNAHTAILFNISTELSETCFTNCIKLLSKVLKCFIRWHTIDSYERNLPKCFDEFRNVVTVLHCREIKTVQPICVTCGSSSCSHCKAPKTVRILIGISPSGLVNYISPPVQGRCTNKAIFNLTGLMKILEPIDAVMVDKGFVIGNEIFNAHGIELIRPHEHAYDVDRNRNIASAQVHIEQRMSIVNGFKILSEKLPLSIVPFIDDITTTICAISNMANLKES